MQGGKQHEDCRGLKIIQINLAYSVEFWENDIIKHKVST